MNSIEQDTNLASGIREAFYEGSCDNCSSDSSNSNAFFNAACIYQCQEGCTSDCKESCTSDCSKKDCSAGCSEGCKSDSKS